jgi:hypothetical protein
MPYSICGLLFPTNEEAVCLKQGFPFVALKHGLSLIPLERDYLFLLKGDLTEAKELSDWTCPSWLSLLGACFSKSAYVEAEFWGGTGMQASLVFEGGRVVLGPTVADKSINKALRKLGVSDEPAGIVHGLPLIPGKDPFDMVGLSRYRSVQAWLAACNSESAKLK